MNCVKFRPEKETTIAKGALLENTYSTLYIHYILAHAVHTVYMYMHSVQRTCHRTMALCQEIEDIPSALTVSLF